MTTKKTPLSLKMITFFLSRLISIDAKDDDKALRKIEIKDDVKDTEKAELLIEELDKELEEKHIEIYKRQELKNSKRE